MEGRRAISTQDHDPHRTMESVRHGAARLHLVARDPYHLFAYWQLPSEPRWARSPSVRSRRFEGPQAAWPSPRSKSRARRTPRFSSEANRARHGPWQLPWQKVGWLTLRVYDITRRITPHGPAPSLLAAELLVRDRAACYLRVPRSGHRYRAELGRRLGRRFIPIAWSNTVETPPVASQQLAAARRKGAPSVERLLPGRTLQAPSSGSLLRLISRPMGEIEEKDR